jgi:hypothetical protein
MCFLSYVIQVSFNLSSAGDFSIMLYRYFLIYKIRVFQFMQYRCFFIYEVQGVFNYTKNVFFNLYITHVLIYTYIRTYIRAYIHTYIHAYMHAYIPTASSPRWYNFLGILSHLSSSTVTPASCMRVCMYICICVLCVYI